jgi:hypothetical protein
VTCRAVLLRRPLVDDLSGVHDELELNELPQVIHIKFGH